MSIKADLMECARCGHEFTVLNLFNKRWVCIRCYKDLKQLSNEFDYAKVRLLK